MLPVVIILKIMLKILLTKEQPRVPTAYTNIEIIIALFNPKS